MTVPLSIDPVLRGAGHPVALSSDVGVGDVSAVSLLGEDLVLWRGREGLHTWQDLCVHRGVRLSLGEVREGCRLRCAYHGWTYDESGGCVAIPAHPDIKPPARARIKTFPCREWAGLIWVSLGESESMHPGFPEVEDPDFRSVPCGPFLSAAGAPRLVENFLDVAHLPIVHEGSLGVSDRAEIGPYEVEWEEGRPVARKIRIYQPNPEGMEEGAEVLYEYGVLSPMVVYLRKTLPGQRQFSLIFAVTPVSEVSSIGWFTALMNYGNPADDEALAAFQSKIFAEDQPIVASQRPERLPLDLAEELHLPSDRLAIAYRQYIRNCGLSFGTA